MQNILGDLITIKKTYFVDKYWDVKNTNDRILLVVNTIQPIYYFNINI